jgi:hypothetical protein
MSVKSFIISKLHVEKYPPANILAQTHLAHPLQMHIPCHRTKRAIEGLRPPVSLLFARATRLCSPYEHVSAHFRRLFAWHEYCLGTPLAIARSMPIILVRAFPHPMRQKTLRPPNLL